jgi:SRSO17 transposase
MEGKDMVETIQQWTHQLEQLHSRIAPRFRRAEPRRRALGYLKGLLATVERKNGWHLAELLGEPTPDGVQRLLNAADWDADAVRDDLRRYVVEQLGSDQAILIVDETGFLKKGTHSAGVKRQYSGTAGRIENCQIGVFLCYASERGSTFIDRELYLPKDWAEDEARRAEAAIAEDIGFATKPELARDMLARAFEAGVPCAWVVGDTIYGGDRRLRRFLEEQEQPFVLAVPSNELLWYSGPTYLAAEEIAARVAPDAWQRLSAGEGAKGPRVYEWALADLWRLQMTPDEQAWGHYLLIRRSLEDPSEVAYYVVFARRAAIHLAQLVRVAGLRWHIESCFESAKGECGLDEYEVRRYDAWYRHITLALLAHALLAVIRAQERKKGISPT